MDLDALRAFLAVVDEGSFAAAATALRWPRATVRRRVDELEVSTGVRLLVRSEQGATPTPAGVLLAGRGRAVLTDVSAIVATVRESAVEPSKTLRIALPVGLPPRVLALLFATLRASREPVLHLDVRFAEDPVALLLQPVDVVVCLGDPPSEGPWVAHELLRAPERLLASEPFLRSHGPFESLEDLRGAGIMMWRGPDWRGPQLPLRGGGELSITPILVTSDLHLLRECASQGHGLAFTIDGGLPGPLGAGADLVPVLDGLVGRERVMRVVMPANLPIRGSVEHAIEQVRSLARPTPSGTP
jgi:DNA-binding transcriptional LysR family regulator